MYGSRYSAPPVYHNQNDSVFLKPNVRWIIAGDAGHDFLDKIAPKRFIHFQLDVRELGLKAVDDLLIRNIIAAGQPDLQRYFLWQIRLLRLTLGRIVVVLPAELPVTVNESAVKKVN
ncbi:hypothetical protein [Paenibacillus sp. J2TS4]|uniref:hypothetical protein n=1 Tax=Paenibacillus sp. J2TS4 TaxID=2807194 RepID=UPI001BCD8ECC|nr:hypothetical protein [Paenibacillus sp. J2TS4]